MSQLSRGYSPNKGDLQRIQRSCGEITQSKLFIDDTPGISINELRAKARRRKRDEDITIHDFRVFGYLHHPFIKARMSV